MFSLLIVSYSLSFSIKMSDKAKAMRTPRGRGGGGTRYILGWGGADRSLIA